jgi:MYXO-CTERM domain-containing protein
MIGLWNTVCSTLEVAIGNFPVRRIEMKHRLALPAAAAVAIAAIASPVDAALTLTPAGIADGFALSTFISAPSSNYFGLGAANLPNGQLAVAGYSAGLLYRFNDVDNQTPANALQSVPFGGAADCATAGGQAYCQRQNIGYYRVANDLSLTQIATAVTPNLGLWGNPVTGHLLSASNSGLVDIDPATGAFTVVGPGGADGVSVSPDGLIAYGEYNSRIIGYNIASHAQVFDSGFIGGGPDGTGIISGGLFNGNIIVNTNAGSVVMIDHTTLAQTIIANGGGRGDFVSADTNNGTLLLFNAEAAYRLSCGPNCAFVPPPPNSAPEPAGLALFALGLAALGGIRRRTS